MSKVRALVHYNGKIKNRGHEGIVFISDSPAFIYIESGCSLLQLRSKIHEKLRFGANERVDSIRYRMPISNGSILQYSSYKLESDSDVEIMFDCHDQFDEVKIIELFVGEAGGRSSGGRDRRTDEAGSSRRSNAPRGNKYYFIFCTFD
jgi:hypothetical protein